MWNRFNGYISRAFDIPPDELRKTMLLQLNVFLILTTLLIVKPTINSIFISELTASALPLAYILTALIAVVGSFYYNRSLEHRKLNKIMERNLIISIIALLIFGWAFNRYDGQLGRLLYLPYTWVGLFGLLTTSQFWILANVVYNAREAKRVFGFIGAGAIAGGIFGGYLATVLSSFLSSPDLLFVAAFLLFWCIPITRNIWRVEAGHLNEYSVHQQKTEGTGLMPWHYIRKSQLMRNMAIVAGVGVIVSKLVDYEYSQFAYQQIPNQERLTAFFGFWLSTISAISLGIQLFVTNRTIRFLGVGNSLLILPMGILAGSVLLLFIPELWVVIFLKVVDGSLKQSVNKTATELLSVPIPIEIKKKTKTFIDVVVDSIATGLAGLFLTFMVLGMGLSHFYISLFTLALVGVWIVFVLRVKREYVLQFKRLLENRGAVEPKKKNGPKEELPLGSMVPSVRSVLRNGNEGQVLYMLDRIYKAPNEIYFAPIRRLLGSTSSKIQVAALHNLYFLKTQDLSMEIEPLVNSEDPYVSVHALRYLVDRDRNNPAPAQRFAPYLNSGDPHIRKAVLICLSQELRDNPVGQRRFRYRERFEQELEAWKSCDDIAEKEWLHLALIESVGNLRDSDYYYLISEGMETGSMEVRRFAIRNAGKTRSSLFIDPLIHQLSDREVRQEAIKAIHGYGDLVIDELVGRCTRDNTNLDEAQFVPMAIEAFVNTHAVTALTGLIKTTEYAISSQAIESLKRLKWGPRGFRIKERFVIDKILDECQLYQDTLSALHSQIVILARKETRHRAKKEELEARNGLMEILENRLDRRLRRIFQFLGLKYPPTEIDPLYEALICGEQERADSAMEILDNLLDLQLKRELIPITEVAIIHSGTSEEAIKRLKLKDVGEMGCYRMLLQKPDIRIRHAVLYVIEKTNDPAFIPLVEPLIRDSKASIREQAGRTLDLLRSRI